MENNSEMTGFEQEMLDHQRRQSKALESIHGVLMFLLAVAIVGSLIYVAQMVSSS